MLYMHHFPSPRRPGRAAAAGKGSLLSCDRIRKNKDFKMQGYTQSECEFLPGDRL